MKSAFFGGFLVLASSCAGNNTVEAGFSLSNGINLMEGVDRTRTTTLAGKCTIAGDTGHIECDGLVIRVATPVVFDNIGYVVSAPTAATCTGSTVTAPSVAVFSFGNLEVAPQAVVKLQGPNAIALVAADQDRCARRDHRQPDDRR